MMPLAISPLELHWRQVEASPLAFDLLQGEGKTATLTWTSQGDSLAVARTWNGEWSYKRVGFFDPHLTIRLAHSTDDLALFRPGWRGEGELLLPDGRAWHWICTSPWGATFGFTDAHGREVLGFEPEPSRGKDPFNLRARVRMDERTALEEDMPLLLTFGWYLMVLLAQDTQARTQA